MKTTPRLHIEETLSAGEIMLTREQAHYLTGVCGCLQAMRCAPSMAEMRRMALSGNRQQEKSFAPLRAARGRAKLPPDIDYIFAPSSMRAFGLLVQKATELGARRLRPVMTAPDCGRARES
jgi:16S rRNA (uracil1498-N3)-methyltransferase